MMRKRSVLIAGHATSVSLEDEFWSELKYMASAQKMSLNELVSAIDAQKTGNLSSALRLYVLKNLKSGECG